MNKHKLILFITLLITSYFYSCTSVEGTKTPSNEKEVTIPSKELNENRTQIPKNNFEFSPMYFVDQYIGLNIIQSTNETGQTFVPVRKIKTVITWTGNDNIKEIDSKLREEKLSIVGHYSDEEFLDYFNHYIDIPYDPTVDGASHYPIEVNDVPIKNTYRLFLQKGLMQYIYEELKPGDKILTDFNLLTAIDQDAVDKNQIVDCYMVNYRAESQELLPVLRYYQAKTFSMISREEDAIKELQMAIELGNDFDEAYYLLGFIFIDVNKMEEAIDALLKAHEINPYRADVLKELGYAYVEVEKYQLAEKYLKQGIALKTDDGDLYTELAYVYQQTQRNQKALEMLHIALEKFNLEGQNDFENTFLTYYYILEIHISEKDGKKASAVYKDMDQYFDEVYEELSKEDIKNILAKLESYKVALQNI